MSQTEEQLHQLQVKLDSHVEECRIRFQQGEERFEKLISCQEANTAAITSLVEETRGVVQLHKDWQGAARIGRGIQDFALWVGKMGTVGAAIAAAIFWVIDRQPPT